MRVVFVLLLAGCAHGLTMERARDLGCREACAADADRLHKAGSAGASVDEDDCFCQFDDGTTDAVSRRPK